MTRRAPILALAGLLLAAVAGRAGPLPAPLTDADFAAPPPAQVALGRMLFFDKILSGNRNIACGTCHDHRFAGGDALSLGIGEGGEGVGRDRTIGAGQDRILRRVPRNAPALYNLGWKGLTVLFADGRVSVDPSEPSGFDTPAGDRLPFGLSGPLAAQALFPVLSDVEMAGHPRENAVAREALKGPRFGWAEIERRLRAEPLYLPLFQAAFPQVAEPGDIRIVHVANAIAAFEAVEFRADDTPFDRYLRGEREALAPAALRGMALFYGKAGCDGCHAGPMLTDQEFHGIGVPQIGPGKGRYGENLAADAGRLLESNRAEDAFRFRTPGLRNVALTAPYGHSGALPTLEAAIRQHLDPASGLLAYEAGRAVLPGDAALLAGDSLALADARLTARILAAADIAPVALGAGEVADLVAFLESLTDPLARTGRLGRPERVPSGLVPD